MIQETGERRTVVATAESEEEANEALAFVSRFGFVGLDADWEQPKPGMKYLVRVRGEVITGDQLVAMSHEVRAYLDGLRRGRELARVPAREGEERRGMDLGSALSLLAESGFRVVIEPA